MKKLLITAVAAFMIGSTNAQVNWKLDASHSKMSFSVVHAMVSETEGRFKMFDGTVSSKSDMDFTDANIKTNS